MVKNSLFYHPEDQAMKYSITSLNTKKAIAEALKKIMLTKPLSKITVSEIIRECGINRKTFYYHFEDIYALLKWMFEQEAIEVVMNFDLCVDYEEAISFVMNYATENQHIISCAYDSMGREEMKRFFYTDFIQVTETVIRNVETSLNLTLDDDFRQFTCDFYTEALAGMLIDWIRNPNKRSQESTMQYISSILRSSITAVVMEHARK